MHKARGLLAQMLCNLLGFGYESNNCLIYTSVLYANYTLVVRAVQQVLVRRCDIFTWCNSWGLKRCDPGRTESIFWSQHCHGNCKIAGGLNVLAAEMKYKCGLPLVKLCPGFCAICMSDDTAIVPAGQPGYDKLHKIKSIGTAFSPTLKELDECIIP